MSSTGQDSRQRIDAGQVHAPVGKLLGAFIGASSVLVGVGVWVGVTVTGIKAEVLGTREDVVRGLHEIDQRPTTSEVRLATVEAVRPLEASMAQVKAQLDILDRRVQRLEDGQ